MDEGIFFFSPDNLWPDIFSPKVVSYLDDYCEHRQIFAASVNFYSTVIRLIC